MPFDGAVRRISPLERIQERNRKREAARIARETPENRARRVDSARESIIVLDELEKLFDGGRCWLRNGFKDRDGHFCMAGGLRHIRARREEDDKADIYLFYAIWDRRGYPVEIITFNDSSHFDDVIAVILLAREKAQKDMDGGKHAV